MVYLKKELFTEIGIRQGYLTHIGVVTGNGISMYNVPTYRFLKGQAVDTINLLPANFSTSKRA